MSLPKPDAAKCEETIAKVLHSMPAFILMVDADGLKGINDNYGHAAGTAYLTEIWDRLHSAFPHTLWHRYGGDEFYGVITTHKMDEVDLLAKAEKVTGMAKIHGRDILVACSIGLYRADKGESAIAAMAMADHAMYQIKRNHHGGIHTFTSDQCLALIGDWPEEWITVPISEGWRVLVYSENTSPSNLPSVDLIIAQKPLPVIKDPVWIPENCDISGLIQKLHDISIVEPLEGSNSMESDLIWEETTEIPTGESVAEVKIADDSPKTELFTNWAEMPDVKEPAVIEHEDETMTPDFIPWRSVKPTVWDHENFEEVPIIMDDPLVKLNSDEKISAPIKTSKANKVKPRRQFKSQNSLKASAENIKFTISSVLSSVELPRIEIPRIPKFSERAPEIIPRNHPKWPKEENPQESVRSISSPNSLPVELIESLKGKILWFRGMESGIGVSHLANHTAHVLSDGLSVLLLDGNLEKPSLIQHYPCEGSGWESSWLRKMPGKPPAQMIIEGNLRVWVLKQAVGPFKDTLKMWEVALFHLKSPEETIIVDGGLQMPPPGADVTILMVPKTTSPEQIQANQNTIWVSRQWIMGTLLYDGSQTGVLDILKRCQEIV